MRLRVRAFCAIGFALVSSGSPRKLHSNGFRVFGWTHAYTLPFVIERLERARGAGKTSAGSPSGGKK